jgi:nucleotide-binding universal stress UspA family protein
VGRRGAGTLARLLIGSTAEAITHEAETPVVVVPDRWQPSEEGSPVVVGVDEAEESDAAIAFAATAATERKVPLRMVRCWQPPNIYGAAPMTDLYEVWYQESKHGLEAAAEIWRHKYPGLEIHSDIRRGHAVGGLIAAAEESTAELLVLGGRSHRRLAPMLLLGSTARGVLHHAPCPIAVVHEPRDRR